MRLAISLALPGASVIPSTSQRGSSTSSSPIPQRIPARLLPALSSVPRASPWARDHSLSPRLLYRARLLRQLQPVVHLTRYRNILWLVLLVLRTVIRRDSLRTPLAESCTCICLKDDAHPPRPTLPRSISLSLSAPTLITTRTATTTSARTMMLPPPMVAGTTARLVLLLHLIPMRRMRRRSRRTILPPSTATPARLILLLGVPQLITIRHMRRRSRHTMLPLAAAGKRLSILLLLLLINTPRRPYTHKRTRLTLLLPPPPTAATPPRIIISHLSPLIIIIRRTRTHRRRVQSFGIRQCCVLRLVRFVEGAIVGGVGGKVNGGGSERKKWGGCRSSFSRGWLSLLSCFRSSFLWFSQYPSVIRFSFFYVHMRSRTLT
ncbi:hypothetical protein R3P38DRAFT_695414 [Favolaschia claudopus]|uniref:Uncharacterized protein n=1 Tax=Favolaschia claudopus TaxID=2862362 RepID=A0AAW0EBB9_9AGAR